MKLLVCTTFFCFVGLSTSNADAQISFTKLIDSNDLMLGQSFGYTNLSATHFDGQTIYVNGANFNEPFGALYTYNNGVLATIVDTSATIPGTSDNFSTLYANSQIVNGQFAFAGQDPSLNAGLYRFENGVITTVANQNTSIPGGGGNFGWFFNISLSGAGAMAFEGGPNQTDIGIYTEQSGNISTLADLNTSIPGGTGLFTDLSQLNRDGENLYFLGTGGNGQNGIYSDVTGSLAAVIDTNDMVPGTNDNFEGFGVHDTDNGKTVFSGGSQSLSGLFTIENGAISTLIDSNTVIPGTNLTFLGFGSPFINGDDIIFNGLDSNFDLAIYHLDGNGDIMRILGQGDVLDGLEIANISYPVDPFSNGNLVLNIRFVDQTQAIYIADLGSAIPEPGTGWLLATIALGVLHRRRRR